MLELETLESKIERISKKLDQIRRASSLIVPITTFSPEPFEVIKDIRAVVEFDGEEYNASFYDANVHSSGCNETEALTNLEENLLTNFSYLDSLPDAKFSAPAKTQIAVLREFIRRKP